MLSFDRLVGALVLVKALDVVSRGPTGGAVLWAAAAAVLVAGGAGLLAGRGRAGWLAVLVGGCAVAVEQPLELRLQHLVLLVGVAVVALVARDDGERLVLWRVQLSALYGTAAVAKLNESYLGGDVLAGTLATAPAGTGLLPPLPLAVLLATGVALVVLELLLAITPWVPRLRVAGTAAAAGFHLAALPLAGVEPIVVLRLLVFGGLGVLLHAASAGLLRTAGSPRAVAA